MILEIALYCLILLIAVMLIFKIGYSCYDSFRDKKPFEEIIHLSAIEKIVGKLKCPKDFYCYKSNYNLFSDKENWGVKVYSICLDEKLQECAFSIPARDHSLCKCPLRDYIAKELQGKNPL